MEDNENLMALLNKDYMPIIYKNIKKFICFANVQEKSQLL